ncbi:MAG: glycerophosphodiester phosphodiesterase [Butyrivibrio sp.]|nr:glycerophosphodiester phosphodiesterase [Butyrivibrio sp.]
MKLVIICLIILLVLAVLYLLMLMPRMIGKPSDREYFAKFLYAHRGLHDNKAEAPENSMAAFRKAVDGGYGIELDVQLTKDNIPVIFHDYELARIARYEKGKEPQDAVKLDDGSIGVKGKVCDYTYDELLEFHLLNSDEKIPKFTDFLEMVSGKVPLIIEYKIEFKDVSVCRIADRILRDYKGKYCIESFNPLGVLWYRKNHTEIMRGQLSDVFYKEDPVHYRKPLYFLLSNLMFNFLTKPDFIAYNQQFENALARRICRYLYKNIAAAWTIKSQENLEANKDKFDIFIFDSFIPKNGPHTI